MSDLQITQLTSLPEAGIQSADVAAVADISASETKKVTIKDFVAAGLTLIDDASIPGAKIGVLSSNQVSTGAIIDSAVTNAKLANSSITLGGVSISLGSNDASPAFNLADATGYPTSSLSGTITNAQLAGSITGAKISDSTITYAKLNISNGDIPGAKITGTSITAGQLASDSVTAAKIAENAVGASKIGSAVITSSHVAANTLTANNLAPNCIGTSELSSSSVETGAIQDNAITTAKILNANVTAGKLAANLPGSILATGAISSTQLAENSVTASELADNSVDTNAIANSAVTDEKIASGIAGTKITDGTITPAKLNTSNLDRSLNVDSGNLGINNVIDAGTASGISYNAQGLITGVVALAASDLPIATTSVVGGVSVGAGLSITGAGALSITNSIAGATVSGITFNSQGQITAATGLSASDIPVATTSAKGAVQITSGGGLTVDGTGNLSTSTSGVSSGTYQSVTVNEKGTVTAGAALTDSLIPNLSASKITSGTFNATRIAAGSIDGTRLSNNSTTVFQSVAQSGFPEPQFSGQMLFDTVEEDAYIHDGTAWQAITTLTKGSLTFGGTYDADQQKVVSVTVAGAAAGLTAQQDLPVASAQTDGVYVVVEKQGTPSGGNAPQQLLVPPDYILGVTASGASSWREVDLSSTVSQQTASNITFSAGGDIVASTVQAAIEEVDTEKLAKAGGTVTGQLLVGTAGSLVFEGSTNNAHKTTLSVVDPDATRTITLPNESGTVITSAGENIVTATMVDGSLTNNNLAAGAAIALNKLATVTSGNFLIGAATSGTITSVGITGDISIDNNGLAAISAGSIFNADINVSAAIAGSKIVAGTTSVIGVVQLEDSATSTSTTKAATPASVKVAKDAADTAQTTANAALPKTGGEIGGDISLANNSNIKFYEANGNGSAYVGIKGATDKGSSGSYTISLPAASPSAGQVLKANASTPNTLEWASDSATDSSKLPLTGGTMQGAINLGSNNITNGGTITGTFVGSVTGNADTATKFVSTVNINGEAFDGSADITVAAAAGTLTGTELKSTVVTSSLTSVGSLTSLTAGGLAYPTSDGTAGQVLKTDGSGTLSFTTVDLTALSASNLTSGTLPDGRFPATLPASSGANLTSINATEVTSGTLPTGVLPTIPSGNIPTLNQDTTGTADKATSIAVADESTDTTCFPLFSTDATGTAVAAKSSASKLTFNSNTGALTATSFNGNLVGNGSLITDLPSSGGTITATASGLLTAGDKVVINSDGTVSKVAETILELESTTATLSGTSIQQTSNFKANTFNSTASPVIYTEVDSGSNSQGSRIVYMPVGDYYLAFWVTSQQASNIYWCFVRAVKVDSEGSVKHSNWELFSRLNNGDYVDAECNHFTVVYDPDVEKALVMYSLITTSSTKTIHTRYVSCAALATGGQISSNNDNVLQLTDLGTKTDFDITLPNNNSFGNFTLAYNKGINKFLMSYNQDGTHKIRVGTAANDGNSVSWTSATTLLAGNSGSGIAIEADLTTSFLAVYSEQNSFPNQRPSAIVISVSGTTATVGSATILSSTNITNRENTHLVFDEEYGRWLAFYDQDTTSHTFVARTITIGSSATSISTGSEISLDSDISWFDSSSGFSDLVYDPYIKKTYFHYKTNKTIGSTTYNWITINKVTIASNNSLSFGTEFMYHGESSNTIHIPERTGMAVGGENYMSSPTQFAAPGKTHHLIYITIKDTENDRGDFFKTVKVQNTTNNMTTENFIGISSDNYADTTTATINIVGSADNTQSGLTAAKKYYVHANNTLALSSDPIGPSVEAGIALSATKLLIKG